MKRNYLLILLLGVFACHPIQKISLDSGYGPYAPKEKEAEYGWSLPYIHYQGATKIGEIIMTNYNSKKLSKVVAEHGGDFYLTDYSCPVEVDKSYMWPTSTYSSVSGGQYDVVRTRTTTTTYTRQHRYVETYPINFYRVIPKYKETQIKKGFAESLEGCSGNDNTNKKCSPETLEKYLKKGFNPNAIYKHGVPYSYIFFDHLFDGHGSKYKYDLEEDYKKVEILLKYGLDVNISPNIVYPDFSSSYRYLINYDNDKKCPSLLKFVRNQIAFYEGRKKNFYKDISENIDMLKKVEALLLKHGAKEFELDIVRNY